MIRVLIVDDHPAMRAGLSLLVNREPGLRAVGAAGGASEAADKAERVEPDVALVDYHLPDGDGLVVCRRLAKLRNPPRTLIFSAFADSPLAVPAAIAGAAGLLSKEAPADQLVDAIRTVAAGGSLLPPISPALVQAVGKRLDSDDLPLLGMLLDGTAESQIGTVLGLEAEEVSARIERMLGRLRRRPAA